MDFQLSDEQNMLKDSAKRYFRDNYSFETYRQILGKENAFSEVQWQAFAEMGWLLVELPEELGGLGCSMLETVVLAEEMGRVLSLEPFISTAVVGAFILLKSGNANAAEEILPEVAGGTVRLALAHSERGDRFQPKVLQTKAAVDGAGYTLNGVKSVVLDAPAAEKLIVSAELSSETALFLVDTQADGVSLHSYPLVAGGYAADVTLDDVKVEGPALLCLGNSATSVLQEAYDRAVVAQIAMAIGGMEQVLDLCAEYLKTREQFKQPIGKFQALQHRMSEMLVEVQESRSALYRALSQLDAVADQRSVAVSLAKICVAKAMLFVGGQGIQLHGGIGLTDEYPIGHFFRYFTLLEKSYGDRDDHLRVVINSYKTAT